MLKKLLSLAVFLSVGYVPVQAEEIDSYTYTEAVKKIDMLEKAVSRYHGLTIGQEGGYAENIKNMRKNLQKFVRILKNEVAKDENATKIVFNDDLLQKVLQKGKTNFYKEKKYFPTLIKGFVGTALIFGGTIGGIAYLEDKNISNSLKYGSLGGGLLGGLFTGAFAPLIYIINKSYIKNLKFIFEELYRENLITTPSEKN